MFRERERVRQLLIAETKTGENNGGLLCTIGAFIITQPAANWEQNKDKAGPKPQN